MILFTMFLPMTACLSGPVTPGPVWAADELLYSSTESMRSLVASTVHNDSDGDEATERYDDEKTETDSTVSVSASSSGSFEESGVTNSEEAEIDAPIHSTGPPSRTQSTDSEATLQYDYSDVPEDEDADKPQDQHAETVMVCEHDSAETGETVMALVPCKRFRGHFCFVQIRFVQNPTPEKRKVCRHILTIYGEKFLSLSEQDPRTMRRSKSV